MGHQDSDMELRALMAADLEASSGTPDEAPAPSPDLAATPLALDHDDAHSWRQTARFFRLVA